MARPIVVCQAGTDRWLEERKKVLTASRIPDIMGAVPYARREGELPMKVKRAMWWGDYLEPANMQAFTHWTGYRTRPCRLFLKHRELPIGCTLDGLVSGLKPGEPNKVVSPGKIPKLPQSIGCIEMKNSSQYYYSREEQGLVDRSKEWREEPPEMYYIQLQVQLLVTGLPFGVLCCKLGATDMRAHIFEPDELLHEEIKELAHEYTDF